VHEAVRRPIELDGARVEITLSVGAVVVNPGSDADEAFRRADHALYRAKREGRDRTVLWDPRADS
jgi:PleD family two-component response regulator